MREPDRKTLTWIAVLLAGVLASAWAFPRAFPFFPRNWEISRDEARGIGLEKLRSLGELPADPYVVAAMDDDASLEYRLLQEHRIDDPEPGEGALAHRVLGWRVTVYAQGAQPQDWAYRANIAANGTILRLTKGFKPNAAGGRIDDATALERALAFLASEGIDVGGLGEPEIRHKDLEKRTDTIVRWVDPKLSLAGRVESGVEVTFAGDELAGFELVNDEKNPEEVAAVMQPIGLFGNLSFFSTFLTLPFVAPVFLRRYHEGEVGVKRGMQILLLMLGMAIVFMFQVGAGSTQGQQWGVMSRQQVTVLWSGQMVVLFFFPMALAAFLSWAVGESLCRETWGRKLAAFDALFQRQWDNRTVALSALRGYAAGFAIAGGIFLALVPLGRFFGAWAPISYQFGPFWNHARFPSFALILFLACFSLYTTLFGRLFLLPWLAKKLGQTAGAAISTLVTSFVFFAPVLVLPLKAGIPIWLASSLASVLLFLGTDLLTTLIASFTSAAIASIFPFLFAADTGLRIHGWIGVLAGAVPFILTARHLVSTKTFVYKYEDVPPHVRRIAERERQRVELETARNIQSSILPQLPAQLAGVELACTYLPATEVGGDFYDVLALEDGRLAVAVGDVAGHGVSSGLVMSMAKSALAVQVTFNPEVPAVFNTLNRMVFQSARKRLLATLCYALVDPVRREMQFASAGHLFPYRVSKLGKVEMLESVAYPLGVRETLAIEPHTAKLEAGDLIFLCSDGVVEARGENSEEHFGFDRLEKALGSLAGHGATVVRDKMIAQLEEFTGGAAREDDLTVL
ncbi:MAG: PP2C family protein-serine/threonine phosphatase, partial [Thermoanaerobaculia bacterium]